MTGVPSIPPHVRDRMRRLIDGFDKISPAQQRWAVDNALDEADSSLNSTAPPLPKPPWDEPIRTTASPEPPRIVEPPHQPINSGKPKIFDVSTMTPEQFHATVPIGAYYRGSDGHVRLRTKPPPHQEKRDPITPPEPSNEFAEFDADNSQPPAPSNGQDHSTNSSPPTPEPAPPRSNGHDTSTAAGIPGAVAEKCEAPLFVPDEVPPAVLSGDAHSSIPPEMEGKIEPFDWRAWADKKQQNRSGRCPARPSLLQSKSCKWGSRPNTQPELLQRWRGSRPQQRSKR